MSEPTHKLDYERRDPEHGVLASIGRWFGERLSGMAEFIGMLIGMFGITGGQLKLAVGLACLAAGIGLTAMGSRRGIFWMTVGAFLIGLVVPLSRRK